MVKVTGHPDATGQAPLFGERGRHRGEDPRPRRLQALASVRALNAAIPDAVAQAALYTYGLYGEARDAVLAVMDTGARAWDTEMIPAERVEHALERTREWLAPLGAHYATHGADPSTPCPSATSRRAAGVANPALSSPPAYRGMSRRT